MFSELKGKNIPIKIWAPIDEVESQALDQLKNIAALPWVAHHVAAMPDVHLGKGATVGSVIAMRDAVCPAAVGVDIGCGLAAVHTNLTASHLPDNLKKLRLAVEAAIPTGFNRHDEPVVDGRPIGEKIRRRGEALNLRFAALSPKVQDIQRRAWQQIGTLGGGNHFIELCIDASDNVWLMLHSGSRNIGKTLAEVHMAKAQTLGHNQALSDPELACFLAGTPEMEAYRHDLYWAQDYAALNRATMLKLYQDVLASFWPSIIFDEAIQCHHNYVAEEVHFGESLYVTRKGAIRAGVGEMGIIPGSMGTASYIVRGLGNPESFCSASHGAGRRMSRGAARRRFTMADLEEQMKGVEFRNDRGVIDEIPGAYKDIDKVMANQADLVEIVAALKQVLVVKGGDDKGEKAKRKLDDKARDEERRAARVAKGDSLTVGPK